MKKKLFLMILIFVLGFFVVSFAAEITFKWDPNSEPDLAGYKIYWGTATRDYSKNVDVGNVVSYTLKDLPDGVFYFAATAYDNDGNESDFSDEISQTIDTISPGIVINLSASVTDKTTYIITIEKKIK